MKRLLFIIPIMLSFSCSYEDLGEIVTPTKSELTDSTLTSSGSANREILVIESPKILGENEDFAASFEASDFSSYRYINLYIEIEDCFLFASEGKFSESAHIFLNGFDLGTLLSFSSATNTSSCWGIVAGFYWYKCDFNNSYEIKSLLDENNIVEIDNFGGSTYTIAKLKVSLEI